MRGGRQVTRQEGLAIESGQSELTRGARRPAPSRRTCSACESKGHFKSRSISDSLSGTRSDFVRSVGVEVLARGQPRSMSVQRARPVWLCLMERVQLVEDRETNVGSADDRC